MKDRIYAFKFLWNSAFHSLSDEPIQVSVLPGIKVQRIYIFRYLGKAELSEDFDKNKNETPRRQDCRQRNRRHRRVKPERPSTNSETPVHRSSSTLQDPIPRISSEKLIDRQKTFSVPIQKQLLTSTVTPLPSLNGRRESVYFQIASSTAADMSSDSSDGEDDEPTIEVKAKDLSNRRRSSFVAWVQENGADQAKKLKERLYQMSLKDNPLEQRRNSFSKFLKRFKSKKSMTPVESRQLQEISETTSPEGEELQRFNYSYPMDNNQNDMMKSIMLNKERRKIPLDDRIDSFYERLAHLKIPVFNFKDPRPRLTALERRRYTLLTKGLKAALNESSDEED